MPPVRFSSRQLLLKERKMKLARLKSRLRSHIHKLAFNESLAKANLQGREAAEQWEEEVNIDHTHMDQIVKTAANQGTHHHFDCVYMENRKNTTRTHNN